MSGPATRADVYIPAPKVQPVPAEKERKCRGLDLNGPDLTGTRMRREIPGCPLVENVQVQVAQLRAGVQLKGGKVVRDVALTDGALLSSDAKGPEFIGATLSATSEDSIALNLRIEDIVQAADPDPKTPVNENADVLVYTLSYKWDSKVGAVGDWKPLCGGKNQALAVPGRWDFRAGKPGNGGKASSEPREVTFACLDSAVAKCVAHLGYKPWRTASIPGAKSPISLDELHQACARAVRADYCGNGVSLTRPGEQINYYDTARVQRDTNDWPLEAEWTPAGARCVAGTRLITAPAEARSKRPQTKVREYIEKTCPAVLRAPCKADLTRPEPLLWTEAVQQSGDGPSKPAPASAPAQTH